MRFRMLWIGLIIGLFLGANAGIFIAAMLFTAKVKDEDKDGNNVNELAQRMWIKANTRPCPQCNIPIEKNDGCNHMTCTNPSCRHEFW